MRAEMPIVTRWIDDLRLAFGRLDVDGWVIEGLSEGTFCAREAGHVVGRPSAQVGNAISLADMVIAVPVPKAKR